jgi:hypothetical protein
MAVTSWSVVPASSFGKKNYVGRDLVSNNERAPYCHHQYTVAHIRGDEAVARRMVDDLRREHNPRMFVSDAYRQDEGWVIALCALCGQA